MKVERLKVTIKQVKHQHQGGLGSIEYKFNVKVIIASKEKTFPKHSCYNQERTVMMKGERLKVTNK